MPGIVCLAQIMIELLLLSLCLFSVTAVRLPDGVTFIVYEFWESEEDWKR